MAYKFQPTEPSGGSKGSGLDFGALPSANAGGIDFLSKANERSDRLKAQKVKAVGELRDYIFGKDSGLSSISEQVIGDDPKAKEYFMNHLNYYTTQLEDLVSTADQPDTEYRVAKLANEFNKSLLPGGGLYPYKQHSEALKEKQKERESAHYAKTLETDPMADDEAEGVLSGYRGAISFNADGKPVHSPLRVPRIGQAYDATKFGEWMGKLKPSIIDVEQNGPTASKIPLLSPDGKTYTESGLLSIDNPENYTGIDYDRVRQHALASPEFNINLRREQRKIDREYDNMSADKKEKLLQKGLDKEKYVSLMTEKFLRDELSQFATLNKDTTKDTQQADPNFMSADKQNDNAIAWNRLKVAGASVDLQREKFNYQKEKDAGKGLDGKVYEGYEVPGLTVNPTHSKTALERYKDIDGTFKVTEIAKRAEEAPVKNAFEKPYQEWRMQTIKQAHLDIKNNADKIVNDSQLIGQPDKRIINNNLRIKVANARKTIAELGGVEGHYSGTKSRRNEFFQQLDKTKANIGDYFSNSPATNEQPLIGLPYSKSTGGKVNKFIEGTVSKFVAPSNIQEYEIINDPAGKKIQSLGTNLGIERLSYSIDNGNRVTYTLEYYDNSPGSSKKLWKATIKAGEQASKVDLPEIARVNKSIEYNNRIAHSKAGTTPSENIEVLRAVQSEVEVLSKLDGTDMKRALDLVKSGSTTRTKATQDLIEQHHTIDVIHPTEGPIQFGVFVKQNGKITYGYYDDDFDFITLAEDGTYKAVIQTLAKLKILNK